MTRVAAALDAVGVPYFVTGSMAAGMFGTPRMSADIDVVIDPDPADKPFLVKVLSEDFLVDPGTIRSSFDDRSMFMLIDPEDHVMVDMVMFNKGLHP